MKKLNQLMGLAAMAGFLAVSSTNLKAQGQGRGNFDPEQMRQRMMDNYRERLEVKGDDEWKLISDRIEKVVAAQRDVRGYSGRGGFGGPRGGRRPNQDGAAPAADANNAGRTARNNFFGEPAPEVTALEKALEAKAPADELKTKMAKVRDGLKDKEAKLTTAQEDLRKVLTVRQEAEAVLAGLLK